MKRISADSSHLGRMPRSLSVQGPGRKPRGSGEFDVLNAWTARRCMRALGVVIVCARAPSLISVRDPELVRAGDMMVDGVIPLGEALRPLGLSRPSTRTWRQERAWSWPRGICVTKGSARTGEVMLAAMPPRRAHATCGSCV
jgi:hypothetical protein